MCFFSIQPMGKTEWMHPDVSLTGTTASTESQSWTRRLAGKLWTGFVSVSRAAFNSCSKLFFNLAVSDVSVLPDLSSYHRNVMLFLPMANRSWTVLNSEAVRHFSSVVVNNRPFFVCVFWHPVVYAWLLTHLNKATQKFTFAILLVQKPVVLNSWVWFSSQGVIWKMAVLAKTWQMFFFF